MYSDCLCLAVMRVYSTSDLLILLQKHCYVGTSGARIAFDGDRQHCREYDARHRPRACRPPGNHRQSIIGRRKAGEFRCWRSTVASPTSSRLGPSWRRADAHDRADPRPALCAGPANAIIEGKINTIFLISYHLPLENAPAGYKLFHDHQNVATKIDVFTAIGLDRTTARFPPTLTAT